MSEPNSSRSTCCCCCLTQSARPAVTSFVWQRRPRSTQQLRACRIQSVVSKLKRSSIHAVYCSQPFLSAAGCSIFRSRIWHFLRCCIARNISTGRRQGPTKGFKSPKFPISEIFLLTLGPYCVIATYCSCIKSLFVDLFPCLIIHYMALHALGDKYRKTEILTTSLYISCQFYFSTFVKLRGGYATLSVCSLVRLFVFVSEQDNSKSCARISMVFWVDSFLDR